jgi:hypothetical protein
LNKQCDQATNEALTCIIINNIALTACPKKKEQENDFGCGSNEAEKENHENKDSFHISPLLPVPGIALLCIYSKQEGNEVQVKFVAFAHSVAEENKQV